MPRLEAGELHLQQLGVVAGDASDQRHRAVAGDVDGEGEVVQGGLGQVGGHLADRAAGLGEHALEQGVAQFERRHVAAQPFGALDRILVVAGAQPAEGAVADLPPLEVVGLDRDRVAGLLLVAEADAGAAAQQRAGGMAEVGGEVVEADTAGEVPGRAAGRAATVDGADDRLGEAGQRCPVAPAGRRWPVRDGRRRSSGGRRAAAGAGR